MDLEEGVEFLVAQRGYFQSQAKDSSQGDGRADPEASDALPVPIRALALLCQALFSSNHFLYVD